MGYGCVNVEVGASRGGEEGRESLNDIQVYWDLEMSSQEC